MPNWCNNNYAVKAATENVLNFVNEGLKNLGMETKDNIGDAIRSLWDGKNEVTMATFRPIPKKPMEWSVGMTITVWWHSDVNGIVMWHWILSV